MPRPKPRVCQYADLQAITLWPRGEAEICAFDDDAHIRERGLGSAAADPGDPLPDCVRGSRWPQIPTSIGDSSPGPKRVSAATKVAVLAHENEELKMKTHNTREVAARGARSPQVSAPSYPGSMAGMDHCLRICEGPSRVHRDTAHLEILTFVRQLQERGESPDGSFEVRHEGVAACVSHGAGRATNDSLDQQRWVSRGPESVCTSML